MIDAKHGNVGCLGEIADPQCIENAVGHTHVRHRSGGAALAAIHLRTLRAQATEINPNAGAVPDGFRRFPQRLHDPRQSIDLTGQGVFYRLHETVDQHRSIPGSGSAADAPAGHEALAQHLQEARFLVRIDRQRAGDPLLHMELVAFSACVAGTATLMLPA